MYDTIAVLSSYISGVIDSEYPDFCTSTQSSVSALHVYQGVHLPDRYQNRLFVGDYSKVHAYIYLHTLCSCVALRWYHTAVVVLVLPYRHASQAHARTIGVVRSA